MILSLLIIIWSDRSIMNRIIEKNKKKVVKGRDIGPHGGTLHYIWFFHAIQRKQGSGGDLESVMVHMPFQIGEKLQRHRILILSGSNESQRAHWLIALKIYLDSVCFVINVTFLKNLFQFFGIWPKSENKQKIFYVV